MNGTSDPNKSFMSEDLSTVTAPAIKRRRRTGKENTGPHKQRVNGLTSFLNNNNGSDTTSHAKASHFASETISPMSDVTNLTMPPVVLKKLKRKVSMGGTNLFPQVNEGNQTSQVDYENIENSEMVGFSDSDGEEIQSDAESDVESEYDEEIEINDNGVTRDKQHRETGCRGTDVCKDTRAENQMNDCRTTDVTSDTWAEKKMKEVPKEYASLGKPSCVCNKCGAQMWKQERTNKQVTKKTPKFQICCCKGRVQLPAPKATPPYLKALYNDKIRGPSFRRCVRIYNSMFQFTSMGGNVDHTINRGGQPYVYRLNGQNHHQFGSLLPKDGEDPRFCQLYIYDTENEVGNRMRWINVKDSNQVDTEVVEGLLNMLDETNQLVKCFRMARDRFEDDHIVDLKIVLKVSRAENGRENHVCPSDEVAAIMVGDLEETCGRRDVIIDSKIDGLKRISDIHPLLMSLQYPLLFPHGDDGYHDKIYYVKQAGEAELIRETVTMREYYAYMLQIRKDGGMSLRLGGRLFQQFIVDSYSAIEQSRLWWMRCNQTTLRNELYKHMVDYFKEGDGDLSKVGKGYILPSSFIGSKRYMQQNFHDALAVCRFIGHPDLFLTMTCNPMWDEVLQMMSLIPGCRPIDCPDIIARVFRLKLKQLIHDIKKKKFFGKCIAVMYVIEWQKRGLPHVHMLIWLDGKAKKNLNQNVDKYVSAEIPNEVEDPAGYAAVKLFNIHGPCGFERPKSPCMKDKKCIRHFPKRYCARTMFDQSGFPIYMRRKTDNVVKVRKATLDNQWVVPYNRDLLVKYQCHINVEICNHARCLKYLFKYCLKGSDRATVEIKSKKKEQTEDKQCNGVDEISRFFDGRYICGAEAAHRIFAFEIHHRSVSVERLTFHLEGEKRVTYKETDSMGKVIAEAEMFPSKLEAFFALNVSDVKARQWTYDEIPQKYTWDRKGHCWRRRKKGLHIGRLCYTHHTTGEKFYLRMLLCRLRGPTSFQHLRTVDGKIYDTYQEACNALGFLENDNEWNDCLTECNKHAFPPQIRQLFCHIMVNCKVADLAKLWNTHWQCMSEDILHSRQNVLGQSMLKLTSKQLQYLTLAEIDKILRSIGRSLKDFKQLPQPPSQYLNCSRTNLVLEEKNYDVQKMMEEHKLLIQQCNVEQLKVFDAVTESVKRKDGKLFFVYGSGGCGKTFLWKTIITKLRAEQKIVLPVASSGIAATLMPGGRTAHSRFKIPILLDETSTCDIAHKSDIAELLKSTDLIIWDEAPMQNRYAFECLDRSLRDIMKAKDRNRALLPFGGITVVLGGDFRQILPVVSKGSRSDIVNACVTRSRLWDVCQLFELKTNMRLNKGTTPTEREDIAAFGRWILDVGNGHKKLLVKPDKNDHLISIPPQHCIISDKKSLQTIIKSTFPDLRKRYEDTQYISERAILTPTNQMVSHLNSQILSYIPGAEVKYFSTDKAEALGGYDEDIETDWPIEYINSVVEPGVPPHELVLKVGAVVMLMRNLNQTLGLCNGSRLIVRRCLTNSVECEVIQGNYIGSRHFIPRMELSPSECRHPFKLIRRQFPLQICYAMTINKSQGQSLENVGIYLPKSVFTHGQLYVAVSRVTSPAGLKVFIESDCGGTTNLTSNIVYDEVFYNLP